jgi:Zn-dependent protease/predicted transcriptional regulator
MRQNIRLGTVAGIEVGLNWSVVVILALFAWELGTYVLPTHSGHASAADWIAGVVGALVLLASVLIHEVSHAVVSRHNDVQVRSITLFVFGGMAQLEGEAHTPGADFRIAAVGPATSIALAGAFGAAQAALMAAGMHGLPVAVLSWLWQINLLLAIFNLIPGAPLDGGRILRAYLWSRSGDRVRASVRAAHAGRIVGLVLAVLGVLVFVSTGSVVGLWPALIGMFVYVAARAEEQYASVQGALTTLDVGQVMTPHPTTVAGNMSVADAAAHMWQYRCDALAVADDTGRLAGVVTAKAVNAVPEELRRTRTVAAIAMPLSGVPVGRADEPMNALLDRMLSKGGHPALVLADDDRLVGIVTTSDVDRAVAFRASRRGAVRAGS